MSRILIVDDEEYIRANLRVYLEDEGYEVGSTSSAEEALELMRIRAFDAGVIDIRLPNRDGNQLIAQALLVQPAMKFVIHTGSTEYCLPDCLRDKGLQECCILLKPLVDMNLLVNCLQSLSIYPMNETTS